MNEFDIQELHLTDYIGILKRRWIILTAALLIALYFFWFPILRLAPLYKATGSLQLDDDKGMASSFGQAVMPEFFWHEKFVNNQINILKSRGVSEKVVRKLALRLQVKPSELIYQIFIHDVLHAIKENPLWNFLPRNWIDGLQKIESRISPPPLFIRPLRVDEGAQEGLYRLEIQDAKRFLLIGPADKQIGTGTMEKPFVGPKFSFAVEGRGSAGAVYEFEILPEAQAISVVQAHIVVTPQKDSSLIHVGMGWGEPKMAGEIVNTIMEAFQETLVNKKARDVSQVLNYVDGQLKVSDENLRKAEDELRKFKGREKIVEMDMQVKEIVSQYNQYEKEVRSLSLNRNQAEFVLVALKGPKSFSQREALFSLGAGLNDPLITGWSQKLSDLLVRRDALLTLYKDEHPKVQQLDGEITSVKKSIINGIEALISALKIKERTFQGSLAKLEKKVQEIPALEQEFFGLQRFVKVGQHVNDFLLQKHAELSVNRASVLPNVFVVEKSLGLGIYVGPNVEKKLLWALLIGLALGIGLTFLVEYFDTTIKTPEQVQKITGLPFLGSIYHFASSGKNEEVKLQMLAAPYSHVAESFRTIKTNILFAASVQGIKKFLLITSSTPTEGKTFVSANLAVAFAQSGKRVLLMEADLRNPSLHQMFGWEKTPGLTNVLLEEEIVFRKIPIRHTQVPNLQFLAAGDNPPNPSELLCSEKMEQVFAVIRDHYDFVIFDSPPVFLTSDPIILAQRVDGVVLVCRSEETKRDILRETVERLLRVEAKILGVVFNDLSVQNRRYYYKKYSYYYTGGGTKKRKRK